MIYLQRSAAILCLLCVSVLCIRLTFFVRDAQNELSVINGRFAEVQSQIARTRSDLNTQLEAARSMLNLQLSVTNETLNTTSRGLLFQTDRLTSETAALVADIRSGTLINANKLLSDADTQIVPATRVLIENPDFPKMIRDARQTIAITGVTMSHIRATANVIAERAPTFAESAQGIATDAHSISGDVKKVADDFVKPRPWYKKALSMITDAAGLVRFF